jgi:propane monooxygenase large subunit
VPCLIREDTVLDKVDVVAHPLLGDLPLDRRGAFRGEYEGRPTPAGRLTGFREWETLHHGKDLADTSDPLRLTTARR